MKTPVFSAKRPRVALLVESSRAYGRGTLSGVAKYVREHGHWSVLLQEHRFCDDLPAWLENWKGDGIITRVENRNMANVIRRLGVPAVYLREVPAALKIPSVLTDNAAVSRMAFEHLQERNFRHFAFCGYNGADYSDERRDSFVQCATKAGLLCHVFAGKKLARAASTAKYEEEGMRDEGDVANWIRELPKPVGLMACNDMRGQQILNACRAVDVTVPDEVAVIGVDNEEVLCDLSDPPLSSVMPQAERIGYKAAALLDGMMNGKKLLPHRYFIEPKGVVTRHSTEVLAIEDRQIATAARFIREHTSNGIDVGDVVRLLGWSRSTLERRYQKMTGHSPKHDILRFRLNRAKQLLAETEFSLADIAAKIGFTHTEHFSRIFKKKVGLTPAQFRVHSRTAIAMDKLLIPTPEKLRPAIRR
jgi:LacI family transcriptional regulator, galactose operon repressor